MDLYIAPKGNELVKELYGVDIYDDLSYCYTGDFACHYIGFRDRPALLEFVDFAKPVINYLFDENFQPIRDLSEYVRFTGTYRNEKPFTFMLEVLSQLFFLVKKHRYFGMKYDGVFDVDTASHSALRIKSLATGSSIMHRSLHYCGEEKLVDVVQERKQGLPNRSIPSNDARPFQNPCGNEVLLAKLQSALGRQCSMLNVLPSCAALSVEAARAGMFVITLDDSDYTSEPISYDLWSQLSAQTFSIDPEGRFSIRDSHQQEIGFDVILFSKPPHSNLLSEGLRHLAPNGILVGPRSEAFNEYAESHGMRRHTHLTSLFEFDYPTNELSTKFYPLDVYVRAERTNTQSEYKVNVPTDVYARTASLFLTRAVHTGNTVLLEHVLWYARQIHGKDGELLQAVSHAYLGRPHEAISILQNLRQRFFGDAQVENICQALSPLLSVNNTTVSDPFPLILSTLVVSDGMRA
jgi:hypothetical protein